MLASIRNCSLALMILSVVGAFTVAAAGTWVSFDNSSETPLQTTVIFSDNSSTILQIDISGMLVENVQLDGEIFQDLQFHNFASTQQIGLPSLPAVAELLAIPGMSNVRVSIISEENITLSGYKIAPFQTPTTDDTPAADFIIDRAFYDTDAYYPGERTQLGEIGVMRDLRVAPIRVVPFQYNPVTQELVVSTSMVVKVEYFGVSDQAVQTRTLTETTPRLAQWYRSTVVNYDNLNIRENRQTDEFQVKYLFVVTEEAIPVIQPLVDFRNAQGYGVEVRPLGPGFNSTTEIRDYIHTLYVSDGLEYVMMVGDYCTATGHTIMPMHYWSGTYSDSWFTMIDPWPNTGNDYLADLAIGRIVYDNIGELQLQIDKTMGYLLEPSTADNWAEHSLLVAHSEQYPQKYTLCKEQIRTFAYAIQTPIFGQAYGGAGATNADVINYLNSNGSGILNYRGHGSQTEWWSWGPTGGFGWDEIEQLTNQDKLFVHFDVCCDNMDFPGYSGAPNGNCFAESFMKHDYGCVAIHSAIVPSYTIPNHDYDKEFYKAIYHEGINDIGYAANFANITVYAVHGTIGQSNIRTYLWLGDAAIDAWTNTPQQLAVSHLPTVFIGTSTLDVTVQMNGSPVENAMVCVNNAEVYNVGYTNASGFLQVDFEGPVTSAGTMQLTVTAHNGLPYQVDIPVIPAFGPYVACVGSELDDSIGNNNGFLNADEQAYVSLSMQNVGVALAENVIVNISSEDQYVSIIDGTEIYGNIEIDEVVVMQNGFQIETTEDAPNGHAIMFIVEATEMNGDIYVSSFSLTISPELQVTLTPATTPIVIPANGGSFDYTIDVANLGANPAAFSVWTDLVLPDQSVYGPLLLRNGVNFAGGVSLFREMTQSIPAHAPSGTYEYRAFMGNYPAMPFTEDTFNFEKSAFDNGSENVNNWNIEGWDNVVVAGELPQNYTLAQNHPNPFNPETTISFSIPNDGFVNLSVFNIQGQKVATLADSRMSAGQYDLVWNAAENSTGIYFYKLTSGDFTQIKKCVLVK